MIGEGQAHKKDKTTQQPNQQHTGTGTCTPARATQYRLARSFANATRTHFFGRSKTKKNSSGSLIIYLSILVLL
jgi:hypothetical protein